MPKTKLRWLPIRQYNDFTLLSLRLMAGGLMLIHGIPKYNRLLEGNTSFPDPLGLGEEFTLLFTIFAEVVCASLVLLGIVTRLAVIPLLVTMAAAIFVVHIHDPISQKETAIIYFFLYSLLLVKGPGKLSLDYFFFKKVKAKR